MLSISRVVAFFTINDIGFCIQSSLG